MKVIETERLILRNWTQEDAEDMYEYAKSDLVGPNAGFKPHRSLDESNRIIEMFINDDNVYAIELKENNKLIGSIGLHDRKPDETLKDKAQIEIGYVLNPDYWGNGYMPEVVERVKTYCFEELKIEILWCGHYDYNINSKRVNEKCGFRYHMTKDEVIELLDNKEVSTMYYLIEK